MITRIAGAPISSGVSDVPGWGHRVRRERVPAEMRGLGLEVALHPRCGTIVETPEEIERVLDGCDVPLCLDTGHVALGGGDPVAIATRAQERIAHLHLT